MAYQRFDMVECTRIDVERTHEGGDLPPGYTFSPADNELVMYFLFNKILGRNMPLSDVVKEIELYEHDPDDLPDPHEIPEDHFRYGKKWNEAYYFTNVRRGERNVINRTTPGGYWKETSRRNHVTYGDAQTVVGFKTSMVFKEGHVPAPTGSAETFIMHEYKVNPGAVSVDVLNDIGVREKIRNFVVCRVINMEIEARRAGLPCQQMPLHSDEEEDEQDDDMDEDDDDEDEDDDMDED